MDFFLTQPVGPVGESMREGKDRHFPAPMNKPTDSKIKGFVLERIGEATAGPRAALLPSPTAPRIVIDLLAALAIPSLEEGRGEQQIELMPSSRQAKRPNLKRVFGKNIPIGLRRCEPHGWINAWIQFLLHIPGIPDLFSFAPRRFEVFREFTDQYFFDQHENHPVSLANGASLVRCLLKEIPFHLFKNALRIDLYDILCASFKAIFSHIRSPLLDPSFSDSIALHHEGHLLWNADSGSSFEEEMRKKIQMRPSEILVAVKGRNLEPCQLIARQFISHSDRHFYDLDAFIEHRPDGWNAGSFVAYVKIEGSWYQCDDDRITSLRSTALTVPLHRSVLLHYRRFEFHKNWL